MAGDDPDPCFFGIAEYLSISGIDNRMFSYISIRFHDRNEGGIGDDLIIFFSNVGKGFL